jgi:hypothetical protein
MMAIRVEWDDSDQNALRYTYEGSWNWDEFQQARKQARLLLDTVDHKVDVIIDVVQTGILPNNILSRANSIPRERHPNEGTIIIVGASPLIRFLYDVARRIYAEVIDYRGYRMVASLEEARSITRGRSDRSALIH